jgi:hypothetical protein
MGNHIQANCSCKDIFRFPAGSKKRQGRPPAAFVITIPRLLLVNRFFQLGPRGKLRDLAGGNLDSGAGLRIASVPRLSLRYRECAKTYQSYSIPFPQSTSNAAHGSVNRSGCLRFADFASARDLINQIGLIHSFSSQVSFIPSTNTGRKKLVSELGNLTEGIFLSPGEMSTVKIRAGSLFCTPLVPEWG